MTKGKGPKGLDWSGIYVAMVVPYKDKNCREVDEDAYRELLRDVLKSDIAGLNTSEVGEGLSHEETIRMLRIAKEETKGRIPVGGRVDTRCANWTWDLVREAKSVIDAGADMLLLHFKWPNISPREYLDDFVNLFKSFDKAVRWPFVLSMAPSYFSAGLMKRIAVECENLAAYKTVTMYDMWPIKELVYNLQEAEAETGRHVCPLLAGDHGLAEALICGAEGNWNGGGSWRGREDVGIYQAIKKGDYNGAFAIQNKIQLPSDYVRGMFKTKIMGHERHAYRFKLCCWLLGKIPTPYARLPRIPAVEETLMLRDALIKSELNVVRTAEECRQIEMSGY
jgi:dihydrodipicolinate synthase/N-acetylneuraminate lyase